jgi:hypothetical protein
MITAFVAMMMLVIEYANVLSGGHWIRLIGRRRWRQYLFGAALGVVPGCLGAFAMVGLYTHKRVSLGAVVATMVASSGDEAFVMLSIFPRTAGALFAGLLLLGIAVGWLTDALIERRLQTPGESCDFHTHDGDWRGAAFPRGRFLAQLRHPSAIRGILAGAIAIFLLLLVGYGFGFVEAASVFPSGGDNAGHHGHGHAEPGWELYTLLGLGALALFIAVTVTDHFLEEHLWNHVLKIHVPRIFLWTLGAIAVIALLEHFVDVESVLHGNLWMVLVVAVAVGLIPDSGPHLVFVTLYASGAVPLSVLAASSIVQDGHGLLPMLAFSRKDFLLVKGIKVVVGLAIGAAMLAAGL